MKTKRNRSSKERRQKREWLFRDNPKCFVCGGRFNSIDEATLEHIIPISKGGKHSMDNLALSHSECNKKKGDKDNFVSALTVQALIRKAAS